MHEPKCRTHLAVRPGTHDFADLGTVPNSVAAPRAAGTDHLAGGGGSAEPRHCHTAARLAAYRATLARAVFGAAHQRFGKDAPRPGRIPPIKTKRATIVEATLHRHPLDATHWSTRMMAEAQGVSEATVRRIWKQHDLKPHRLSTFKVSRDPRFVEKLTDVVGLYLNPPDKALVLCVDEKSQIQALYRTQPGLPLSRVAAAR